MENVHGCGGREHANGQAFVQSSGNLEADENKGRQHLEPAASVEMAPVTQVQRVTESRLQAAVQQTTDSSPG